MQRHGLFPLLRRQRGAELAQVAVAGPAQPCRLHGQRSGGTRVQVAHPVQQPAQVGAGGGGVGIGTQPRGQVLARHPVVGPGQQHQQRGRALPGQRLRRPAGLLDLQRAEQA
jgi:hypothetical protein